MSTRTYFPGGITPGGFFSYFGDIPWGGERTIYLKGTSGCGKSTFMKKAAAAFEAQGFDTECFRCASDPNSLDALRVHGAGFSIIDGTAPHIADPPLPVAHDEIFDMTAFVDAEAASAHKQELLGLQVRKKRLYARACDYLAAAAALERASARIYGNALDPAKRNAIVLRQQKNNDFLDW